MSEESSMREEVEVVGRRSFLKGAAGGVLGSAGMLAGLTEGAEKTWLAERAPREERALTFGAMALVSAGSALFGNALCGWLLMAWGPQIFAVAALIAVVGALLTIRK